MKQNEITQPSTQTSSSEKAAHPKHMAEEVADLAKRAKAKGQSLINEKSTSIGAALANVADKSDAAIGFLEQKYENQVSPAIESAQQRLRDTSDYLQTQNSSSMSHDLKRVARRHPEVTAVVIFGLGFLLARALYSSK